MNENKLTIKSFSGAIISVILAMICILIFAFVIKLTNMSDILIRPINQAIKIFSIVFGARYAIKHCPQNPIILGILTGVSFTIIAFLLFSILNGSFVLDKSLLNDTIFGGISGAICGILFAKLSPSLQQ